MFSHLEPTFIQYESRLRKESERVNIEQKSDPEMPSCSPINVQAKKPCERRGPRKKLPHWLKRSTPILPSILICFRLKDLDEDFFDMIQAEEAFPPDLPDMKTMYTNFYNEMSDLTRNIVCASCGCIDHHVNAFTSVPI